MTDSIDNHVDDLVEAARTSVSGMASRVRPDFAAMVARARAQAPERVSAEMVAEAAALAPVLDIRSRTAAPREPDLDTLVGDAKAGVDRMVEARRLEPIPPLRRSPRSRRMIAAIVTVSLAAAAAILVFAIPRMGGDVQTVDGSENPAQAFHNNDGEDPSGTAVVPAPREPAPQRLDSPPAIEPVVEVIDEAPEATRPRPHHHSDDELRALSDEAHALWRKGDRKGAEQRFVKITKLGGRGVLAELAWGDLFALARQMGDGGKPSARWRAYLDKFPRGRYADDARAGLCRRAPDAAQCWAKYLRDLPRGSYRAEAEAAVGSTGSPGSK